MADVQIGSELRTGSGSKDGHEVVIGTAMMLIGANSRTVAAAVDAEMVDVNRNLPPDIQADDGLQPHQAGAVHDRHRRPQSGRGGDPGDRGPVSHARQVSRQP